MSATPRITAQLHPPFAPIAATFTAFFAARATGDTVASAGVATPGDVTYGLLSASKSFAHESSVSLLIEATTAADVAATPK